MQEQKQLLQCSGVGGVGGGGDGDSRSCSSSTITAVAVVIMAVTVETLAAKAQVSGSIQDCIITCIIPLLMLFLLAAKGHDAVN